MYRDFGRLVLGGGDISDNPSWYKRFKMFVEVAIVVYHVHFLVNFLVLFQNLGRGGFRSVLYHLVVNCVQIVS